MQVLTPLLGEATTGLYQFSLVDEASLSLAIATMDTLTLTYYDWRTGEILNGRDTQDVFNTGDVGLTTDVGPPLLTTVTWTLQPEDTILLSLIEAWELHVAVFRWTWDSGRRAAAHQIGIGVQRVRA